MYNQGQIIGRINPAFTGPAQDQLVKTMGQSVPPPYYPSAAGIQVPRANLNSYGYPNQGPYIQQALPGMAVYPQRAQLGHTEVPVERAVFVSSMPPADPVPDYMCYSIFTMFCCFLPLGSAAVACSCTTEDANVAGHRELALSSSRSALILNNIALGLGLVLITTGTILLLYVYGVFE
ncbi:synapse differentiation-inducing gene protein 1-like [Puntigrus tetrazona]|uniref:synapse differentiation-inducing gene protein 1-like n=1 Tax=Puntigrus tetrazona TaxID=1606681 RepID=UPI001C89F7F7|nr:synapse differentiation-inducing gene protein 1-like [Puntigrus tetrazona]